MNNFEHGPESHNHNESPVVLVTPEMLVESVERETAAAYAEVAEHLNENRELGNKIKIVPEDELLELAVGWAQDPEVIDTINRGLYFTKEDAVVLLAVPHADFTHEEIVDVWSFAGANQQETRPIHQDENFWRDLKQWDSKALCRFDPNNPSPVRFVAIETGFDPTRIGPRLFDDRNFDPASTYYQLSGLFKLRENNKYIYPVDLFAGAVNAYRLKDKDCSPEDIDDKTYTWDMLLASDDGGCIAGDGWIPTGRVDRLGIGHVSFITGMYGRYARRMVMKTS